MTTEGVWSVPLGELVSQAKDDIDTVVRRATLELFSSVGVKSPVDTGRFRANWNVQYATADLSTTASTDQGRMTTEIAKVESLAVGGIVYMTNSLPYAAVLEFGGYPNPPKGGEGKTVNGFSKQAPAGMVRLSVVEFQSHVKAALSK